MKKNKRRLLVILVLSFLFNESIFAQKLDSLIRHLDDLIKDEQVFINKKKEHIDVLKEMLNGHISTETKYQICLNVAEEYERFQCDSAMFYAQKAVELSSDIDDRVLYNSAVICLSSIASKAGFFDVCMEKLESIDTSILQDFQVNSYYSSYYECCVLLGEFRNGFALDEIEKKRIECESLTKKASKDGLISPLFKAKIEALEGLKRGDWENTEKILLEILPSIEESSTEMASIASLLSGIYHLAGNIEKQKEYLAISAISDVKSCVKENTSLRVLANVLYEEGDLDRANTYINKSLADANFYNSRLRNTQVSKVLPIIEKAYMQKINEQTRVQNILMILISILSFLILAGAVLLIVKNRKITRVVQSAAGVNEKLNNLNTALEESIAREKQTNADLIESNHIKELFIGNFLDICTEYIDKLHRFKIKVNKKLKAGQTSDLLRITSHAEPSSQEKKELYASFDRAFLSIYPTFVSEFNQLLRDNERYSLDSGELNQELRIYALIKLGITDVQKIQTFLNCTARTIYNYRSVVRRRAVNPDIDFDEQVKALCQVG